MYDYLSRVKPLLDINNEIEVALKDFEKKWTDGTFPGWPVWFLFNFDYQFRLINFDFFLLKKETTGALTKSGAFLDLSAYTSWEVRNFHLIHVFYSF